MSGVSPTQTIQPCPRRIVTKNPMSPENETDSSAFHVMLISHVVDAFRIRAREVPFTAGVISIVRFPEPLSVVYPPMAVEPGTPA